jgi:TRAP-type C4-dicarboxylate transport system substrate-binding protein
MDHRYRRGMLAALALASTAALVAGCAGASAGSGQAGDDAASGQGVAPGASMEEYIAAFEDVEPIELVTQTTAPPGAPAGAHFEAYHAAIEEWSGGKITFDVSYSNAIAAPDEAADALVDGRLDLVNVQTVYSQEEFPANNALVDLSFLGEHTPVVGQMQSVAWMNEVGFANPELAEEFRAQGMQLLLPTFHGGSPTFMCIDERRTLEQLQGAQSVASGKSANAQLQALGVTPVSMAYPEIYESLQRGVVDCVEGSFTIAVLGGYIESTPNVVVDPVVGFSKSPGSMAMSAATWDSLPLVAQQLFHDRLDAFITASITSVMDSSSQGVQAVLDAGGELQEFDQATRDRMGEVNQQLLGEIATVAALSDGSAFVDSAVSTADEWAALLTGELGYESDVPYATWPEAYADGVDVQPFVDRFSSEILASYRPE